MSFLMNKCLLCLSNNNNLKNVLSEDDDGIVLEEQLKFILSEDKITFCYNEIVNFEPHRPKYICIDCQKELTNLHKFKQKCFKSLRYLSLCVEKIIKDSTTNEYSKITDETINKHVNIEVEKVIIKIEPEAKQHSEDTNINHLEEVMVKWEPQQFQEEIDIKDDPLVSNETQSENWLQNETTNDTGKLSPQPKIKPTKVPHKRNNRQKTNLKPHQHTGEGRFQCEVCHKSLTSHNHLVIHNRIHTGEKPYECDLCDKAFNQKINLTTHKRIHTGEKPFKCELCDKAFSDKPNLTRHKRSHSGERAYKCDLCSKAFTYKHGLVTHQRRTHSCL